MTTARTSWLLSRDGTPDGRELVVDIPLRVKNPLNGAQGRGWRPVARERKRIRSAVGLVMAGHLAHQGVTARCCAVAGPRRPFQVEMTWRAARVVLTRLAPSSGLDFDGLTAALKSVRDGTADALGIDDSDKRVTWQYAQERSKVYGVRITVTGRSGSGLASTVRVEREREGVTGGGRPNGWRVPIQ